MKASLFFRFIFILILQFSATVRLFAQEKGVLSLSLNVLSNRQPVNEAAVKFTSDNKEVELNVTQENGRYTTIVPFGNTYFITIGKDTLVPKIIKVDSRIPEKFRKAFFYHKIAIELFGKYDKGIAETVLHEPYAEVKFNPILSNFEILYNKKIKKSDQKAKEIAKVLFKEKSIVAGDPIEEEKARARQEAAEKQHVSDEEKIKTDNYAREQQEKAKFALKEQNEKDKKQALVDEANRNQKIAEINAAKQAEAAQEKKNKAEEEAKLKEEKINRARLEKQALEENEKEQKQALALLEKARMEQEEKIENEKKQARDLEEKRLQKIKEAKAVSALEEEQQKTAKQLEDQKARDEKNKIEQEQKQEEALAIQREQAALEAKEKAQKDEMERLRLLEFQRLKADALAKEMQEKAREELRIKEAEAARINALEDQKQQLARTQAREAELAAKKAFEADLEAKQKKLSLEKNNRLKEKDIAALILEHKAYPKGRTEIFDGYRIFRIVIKENETTYILYKRSTYSFGEYYFQNNRSITKTTFEKDTHIIN